MSVFVVVVLVEGVYAGQKKAAGRRNAS